MSDKTLPTEVPDPTPATATAGATAGPENHTPSVLFVCVGNGGKSQMAAAIMRQIAGDAVDVHSAGTAPKDSVNALSARVIEEVGASMAGETPKAIDPQILRTADRVVVLGSEATVEPVDGMRAHIETWQTDEPSERGIEGEERMRLVRDDINARVIPLAMKLTGQPVENALRYR